MPSALPLEYAGLVDRLSYAILTTLREASEESLTPRDISGRTGYDVLVVEATLLRLCGDTGRPDTAGIAVRLARSELVTKLHDGFALTHRGIKITEGLRNLVV
ncbi:MAG: hypothetical protein HY438_01900 [DPANN group archaeon]|nr:hypothetical protein [DPANN group archaeon]